MNIRNLSKMEAAWVIGGLAIIVIMLVGVLVAITDDEDSGTTPYQPKTTDEILEEKFNKVGVFTDNSGDAFEVADAICLDSAGGMYPHSIARSLTSNNYRISDEEAKAVVAISIKTLCPKFSDRVPANFN